MPKIMWTKEQIEELKRLRVDHNFRYSEIAKLVGHTANATQQKACALGFSHPYSRCNEKEMTPETTMVGIFNMFESLNPEEIRIRAQNDFYNNVNNTCGTRN